MNIKRLFLNEKGLRTGWRILIFLSFTLLTLLPIVLALSLLPIDTISQDNRLFLVINTFPIFLTVIFSTYLITRFIEKRRFRTIGFEFHSGVGKEIFSGLLIGFLMISLIFFIQLIFGDVNISFANFSIKVIAVNFILYTVIFAIQSSGEEIFFRGYLFQALIEGTNKITAVGILSVMFGGVHLFNPNASIFSVLNIALTGILFSIAYIRTRSLWLPCALHFSWNFFTGFVYSVPVSGVKVSPSLLTIKNNIPEFLSGGNFGPEGGIIGSIVFLAGIFYISYAKKFSIAEISKTDFNESEKENYEDK